MEQIRIGNIPDNRAGILNQIPYLRDGLRIGNTIIDGYNFVRVVVMRPRETTVPESCGFTSENRIKKQPSTADTIRSERKIAQLDDDAGFCGWLM